MQMASMLTAYQKKSWNCYDNFNTMLGRMKKQMNEKKETKVIDILTSIPVILILLCCCLPVSCVLTAIRLARMKEKEKSYKVSTVVLAVLTFGTMILVTGMIAVETVRQSKWDKEYQSYMAAEDYVSAEQMLDEKKEQGITSSLTQSYLELYRLSGDGDKAAAVVKEYFDSLDDKTNFSEFVEEKLAEIKPELDPETQRSIDDVLAQVAAAREEKLQESIAESVALAEQQEAEEASKAAEESSKAAEKAAKESSKAAEKAAEESSKAAEKAAEESSKAAAEASKAEQERETQLQEAEEDIKDYIKNKKSSALKQLKKIDGEIFDQAWINCLTEAISNETEWTPTVKDTVSAYCSLYRESHGDTISEKAKKVMSSLETLSGYDSQIFQLENKYGSIDLENSIVYTGIFYVSGRLETAYINAFTGENQDEINSYKGEDGAAWAAYNVEYILDTAWPGNIAYVLLADKESPFPFEGAYTVTYIDTGLTKTLIDAQGFEQEAPVYKMTQDYGEMEEAGRQLSQLKAMRSQEYADLRRQLSGEELELTDGETAAAFSGDWWDINSQRCNMTITQGEDGTFYVSVNWGSSAWETTQWTLSGRYDGTAGAIVYSNCTETDYVYDDAGHETASVAYTDGTGKLYLAGGYVYWEDDKFDRSSECCFERSQY